MFLRHAWEGAISTMFRRKAGKPDAGTSRNAKPPYFVPKADLKVSMFFNMALS